VFADAVSAGLDELLERLEPASWVVSAGFDAHRSDPLGGLDLSDEAFRTIGRALRGAAAGSPIVAVLEGGYDLKALFRSVREFTIGVSGVGRS
jgi:acetoin utilization deacetylase AcuC-like enzyme